MSTRCLVITLVFLGSLSLSGCGSPSASEIMKNAIMKANEGKYAESNSVFSEYLKKALPGDEARQKYWDTVTKQKTVSSIEIISEESLRTAASVDVKVIYKDGTSIQAKEMLVKENGEWRISSNNLTTTDQPKSEKKGFGVSK